MELRKAGARRHEAGLKDFSAEKYFWSRRETRELQFYKAGSVLFTTVRIYNELVGGTDVPTFILLFFKAE